MEKPSKKPEYILQETDLMEDGCSYTPDELHSLADWMKQCDILSIRCLGEHSSATFTIYKLETQAEANKRYKQDLKRYSQWAARDQIARTKRIKALKQEAKELGIKLA